MSIEFSLIHNIRSYTRTSFPCSKGSIIKLILTCNWKMLFWIFSFFWMSLNSFFYIVQCFLIWDQSRGSFTGVFYGSSPNPKCQNLYLNLMTKDSNSFFFSFIFISWRLITLQYYSGFCHTLTWISHGFTCIPHPDPPSHLPLYPVSQKDKDHYSILIAFETFDTEEKVKLTAMVKHWVF